MEQQAVMRTVFLVCLFSANYVQKTSAHTEEHLQVTMKEKVWSAVMTLFKCYYDTAFHYTGRLITPLFGEMLETSDKQIVATCAVEIGILIVTEIPENQRNCLDSKYVRMLESLLVCTGMADKVFKVSESLIHRGHSHASIPEDSHYRTYEFQRKYMYESIKSEDVTHSSNKAFDMDEYDKDRDIVESEQNTEEVIDDNEEVEDRNILESQRKTRTKEANGYQLELLSESGTSDSKSKKEGKTSGCSIFDMLEGAGRGFLGGGSGGYFGGDKLGGLAGAGVGTVVGGVAGCFFGGYTGGVIGGTAGGAAGGILGGWKGLLKGGSLGAGVAGINWDRVKEVLELVVKEIKKML